MNRNACDQESLLVASLRSGGSAHELDEHLATCQSCAETRHVAQSLLQYAAMTSAQGRPPTAKRVWHKMQERQRQFARRQATRGLAVMWALAAAYLVALTTWYFPALWPTSSAVLQAAYSSLSNGAVLAGITTASTSIALGALCLLFMGSRIESPATHKERKS
jgi:hypothetical protein